MQQVFPRPAVPHSNDPYDSLMSGAAGYPSSSPIFVVGMPRSGSTLVEHILSSHPQAHGAGIPSQPSPHAQMHHALSRQLESIPLFCLDLGLCFCSLSLTLPLPLPLSCMPCMYCNPVSMLGQVITAHDKIACFEAGRHGEQ